MERALELAERGLTVAHPNPAVGAVVVRAGEVVGEGYHRGPGTPHAEVEALEAAGNRAQGSDLYVTLEPCVHHGRTPPCVDRIEISGIRRVFVGALDPDEKVRGKGVSTLSDRGIEVFAEMARDSVYRLDPAYFVHRTKGRPYVVLKVAATLDGLTAATDGSSRWITSEEARADAHRMRGLADAVAVGIETVLADDPDLSCRLEGFSGRQPIRVVFDSRGRIPPTAKMLGAGAPVVVLAMQGGAGPLAERLKAAGKKLFVAHSEGQELPFDVIEMPEVVIAEVPEQNEGLSVSSALEFLGRLGVVHLLVEGGSRLLGSFLREPDAADRLTIYVAAKTLGGGKPIASGADTTISDARTWRIESVSRLGPDLRIEASPVR
jgi:diaminohydroxyphosphoribosylaminopyrimidine deaminase/5-amino-6-(5-phosphoribosylamino)uracil reductase